MKIPFHIHVNLAIDYNMSNDDRCDLRDAVERILVALGAEIISIGAGPYSDKEGR
jgi:hypothetical protein